MNRLSLYVASVALTFVLACGAKEEPAEAPVKTLSEGERLLEEGSYEEAQDYFEAEIAAAPTDAENHFMAGQAAAMAANYDEAVAHINKAMELAPNTAAHYDWLGRIYGAQARIANLLGRIQFAPKVKENFEKAAELDPKNSEVQFFLGTFYVVAPPNMGGDREKGAAIAEKLLKSDPLSGHRLMAQIHLAKRDTAGAEAAYKEAIALSGDDPQSYADLAGVYLSTDQLDLARENFDKALELAPTNQAALLGIGQLGAKSEDRMDEGVEALEKLASLERNIQSPNMGDAYFLLGSLYEKKGRIEEAIGAYETAAAEGHMTAPKSAAALKPAEEPAAEEAPAATDGMSTGSTEAAPAEDETGAEDAATESGETEAVEGTETEAAE
jgi:tetratricopeptide (TPR) repeat protein